GVEWRLRRPRRNLGRGGEGGGPKGPGRPHLHRPGEAVPGHHLPRRRHQQDQARLRLFRELDEGLEGPGLDGACRHHTASAARNSSRRTRPTFTSGSATATTMIAEAAGTTSRAPCSHCRCQNTLAPTPAATMARRSRLARLAARAATAEPLIPSIRCSATTSPSSLETSIAPRTPRTRVTGSSVRA